MSHTCFRYSAHQNCNAEVAAVSHTCFGFSTYKNRNTGEVAVDVLVVRAFLSNISLVVFAFLITKNAT